MSRSPVVSLVAGLFVLGFLTTAHADIEYHFSVNTTSISGTSGSLDFQFNPGPLVSESASLDILNFGTAGTLAGGPLLTGDASGILPGPVMLDNGLGLNDYFEGFTFGASLLFDVRLYGPAVNSPDGTSTSGSTFAFSMFLDPAGSSPTLTSDLVDGFAVLLNVNLDGTATLTNFSAQTVAVPASPVPEPNSVVFLGTLLAWIGAWWGFRARRLGLNNRSASQAINPPILGEL